MLIAWGKLRKVDLTPESDYRLAVKRGRVLGTDSSRRTLIATGGK